MLGAVCATKLALVWFDMMGSTGFWSKKTPSLSQLLYFETCVTTAMSMEKQTQFLSSARTNIFKVILRFVKKKLN